MSVFDLFLLAHAWRKSEIPIASFGHRLATNSMELNIEYKRNIINKQCIWTEKMLRILFDHVCRFFFVVVRVCVAYRQSRSNAQHEFDFFVVSILPYFFPSYLYCISDKFLIVFKYIYSYCEYCIKLRNIDMILIADWRNFMWQLKYV